MNKKTGVIGIIITFLILTTLVVITNIDTSKFSYVEGIINKLVMPVQNGLTYLKNKIAKNNQFFEDINNLKKENEDLKKQNEELSKNLSELGIINITRICKFNRSIYKIYNSSSIYNRQRFEQFNKYNSNKCWKK